MTPRLETTARSTTGALSTLHPTGFGHIPRVLLSDERADALHRAVYAAIASAARHDGSRWVARELMNFRIQARARLGRRQTAQVEERRRVDYGTLRQRRRDLEQWAYLKTIRGAPHVPNTYELLPTGNGNPTGNLSSLHPTGWAHVPIALMVDRKTRAYHVAVYAAIVDGAKPVTHGSLTTWVSDNRGRKAIATLSGCGMGTVKRCISELARWGYINYTPGTGTKTTRYILLQTREVTDALDAEALDDLAQGSPMDTGARGGRRSGELKGGGAHELPSALAFQGGGVHEPGSTPLPHVHEPTTPPLHEPAPPGFTTQPSTREKKECIDSLCDKTHMPLTHQQYSNLQKAVGQATGTQTLEELRFRLDQGAAIENPYAFARMLGECYRDRPGHRDRCASDLHGAHAMDNHRAGRLEASFEALKAEQLAGATNERLAALVAQIGNAMTFPKEHP